MGSRPPQHKSDACDRDRATKALELRLTGATYAQIAAEMGWAGEAGPRTAIDRMLTRREIADVAALREVEGDRLDKLMAAHWNAAVSGDADATKIVLQVIDRRMKLFGLAAPERAQLDVTVVSIEDNRARLLAKLQADRVALPAAPALPAPSAPPPTSSASLPVLDAETEEEISA